MTTLAYHKVDRRFELGLTTVDPVAFKRHVQVIHDAGYTIGNSVFVEREIGSGVCMTFDDGYDCFFRNVIPVLTPIGASATTFVITDYVGRTNAWDLRLSYRPYLHMNASQLREASDLGFEVGSHTRSHRDITRLGPDSVKEELAGSKKCIEDIIGKEVEALSFPYGKHDRRVAELAFELGYKRVFGMGLSVSAGALGRIPVYKFDSAAAVLRKVKLNRLEILKSAFIHSFSGFSALISTRMTTKST